MSQSEKDDFQYTFYAFSNRESDKVKEFVEYLFETLEGIVDNKRRSVTGFNPERDMIPGRNLIHEHYRLLGASRYTFFIVDPSFMKKPWEGYLSESSLRSLTEDTAGHEGPARFILITLEITKEAVVKKYPQLNIKENIHFQGEYKKDERKWARLKMAVKNELQFQNVEEPIEHDRTGILMHPSESSKSLEDRDDSGLHSEPEEACPHSHSVNGKRQSSDVRPREAFYTSINRKGQARGSSLGSSANEDEEDEKGGKQPDTYMDGPELGRSMSPANIQVSITPIDTNNLEDFVDGSPKHTVSHQSSNQPAPQFPVTDENCENMNVREDMAAQAHNQAANLGAADNTSCDTVDGPISFYSTDGATASPQENLPTNQRQITSKGLRHKIDSGFDEDRTISGVNLMWAPPQDGDSVEMSLDYTTINIRPDALGSLTPEEQRRNIEMDEAVIREKRQQTKKKVKPSHGVTSPTAGPHADHTPGNIHVGLFPEYGPVSHQGQNLQKQQLPVTTTDKRIYSDRAAESKKGGIASDKIRSSHQTDTRQEVWASEVRGVTSSTTDKAKLQKSEDLGSHENRLSNEPQRDMDQSKVLSAGESPVTVKLCESNGVGCSLARLSPQLECQLSGSRSPSEHDEEQSVEDQDSKLRPQQTPCSPGTMLTTGSLSSKPVVRVTPYQECTNYHGSCTVSGDQQRNPSEHSMPSLSVSATNIPVDTGVASEMSRQLNEEESQFPSIRNRSQSGTGVTECNPMNRSGTDVSVNSLSQHSSTLNQSESDHGTTIDVNPADPVPGNMSPGDIPQATSSSVDTQVNRKTSQEGASEAPEGLGMTGDDTYTVTSSVPQSVAHDDKQGSLHQSTESAGANTDTGSAGFLSKAWNFYKQING